MKLVWFISDHGYGHIMRNTPLILEALSRPGVELTVVSAESHLNVLRRYLRPGQAELIPFEKMDYGLEVIPGTLLIDVPRLEAGAAAYTADFGRRAAWAEQLLREGGFDRAVVDMPVWALLGAKAAGVPGTLITNFTWVEIYQEYLPAALVEPFREAYRTADQVLYYELSNPLYRAMLPGGTDCGLTARPFDPGAVAAIRAAHRRPIVFCSIGFSNQGLAKPLQAGGLPFDFITTAELAIEGENVTRLGPVEDLQNYAAAADYCIAKAGWGTVAEILLAGKPAALMGRDTVAEDRMTIQELERRRAAIKVQVDQLEDLGGVMERLTAFASGPFAPQKYTNNAPFIVDRVLAGH